MAIRIRYVIVTVRTVAVLLANISVNVVYIGHVIWMCNHNTDTYKHKADIVVCYDVFFVFPGRANHGAPVGV